MDTKVNDLSKDIEIVQVCLANVDYCKRLAERASDVLRQARWAVIAWEETTKAATNQFNSSNIQDYKKTWVLKEEAVLASKTLKTAKQILHNEDIHDQSKYYN